MIPVPRFLFSNFGRRSRAVLTALVGLFSSTLLCEATELLFFSSPGGPMEYNTLGAVLTDQEWTTEVSMKFEVSDAIRIQKIKAWINGGSTARFAAGPVPSSIDELATYYSQTFAVEPVLDAPAKWQGLDSLKWDFQPGVEYQFFMSAPVVPLGYGYQGPIPNVEPLINFFDYQDYSQPDNIP